MATVNVYLTFKENCEEAFDFYKSIFGGEFTAVNKFKDMPPSDHFVISEKDKNKIMHISLPISKETILMGSDMIDSMADKLKIGTNFSLSVSTDTIDETKNIFNKLLENGTVIMPVEKTFWGSYFGMLTDKFGIQWMVNCQVNE